jgi:hypothetical protein
MRLSDFIRPDLNIARSINLERDHDDIDFAKQYQVTSKALDILSRFVNALEGEKISAWSLTGPYGMGKSAFINYLLAVTGPPGKPTTEIALKKLLNSDPRLYKRLFKSIKAKSGKHGFFQIAITAAYEPVNNTLARGIHNALRASGLSNGYKLINQLQSLMDQRDMDSQELLSVFKGVQQLVGKPVLIVIDEFGKNLDYLSHHHGKGDIFIMQQLAEMDEVYLWVCLHQAFDEYASGLSTVQRQEWSKVQGRFEDIPFVESTAQMLDFIKKALKQNPKLAPKDRLKKWAEDAHTFITQTFLAGKEYLDQQIIVNIYPLHPITAIALIELCRRFAQNDRTLFTFMCSGDRYALPAYLKRTEVAGTGQLPTVGLDYLYDYFFNISVTVYVNRAESQRWVEIHDIIRNAGHLSEEEQVILKTIGVLNLLFGTHGVMANLEVISTIIKFSLGLEKRVVKKYIDNLVSKNILLFRKYAGEYRLWEGSDFDVYEAIREKKNNMAIGNLDAILQQYLPLPPVIPSRHAYETGTVRHFERRWLNVEALATGLIPQKGFDGLFLYCYGTIPEPANIPVMCADGRPLLIAYTSSQTTLRELALEVAAARSVLADYPELVHDSVARKEIKFRIKAAEQQFREYLARLYAPGSKELIWYMDGKRVEIRNSKELSAAMSTLCDVYYAKCPRIGNEMINYEHLSSAAARARRELVEAMATRAGEKQLGLSGFGPEVAIYRSLLLAEGLHKENQETGHWYFALEGRDPRFKELWNQIDACVNAAGDKGVTIEEILGILQSPPFGMRLGPAPIYICLYLLVKSDEIAVFQEGNYKPYITASEMALMVKRPDLFTLKRFVSTNVGKEIFDTYRSILYNFRVEGSPGLRNATLLGIVGPLVKFVDGLTPYAKSTRQISPQASRVRAAILNSTDPLQLLFEELPRAVGVKIASSEENDHSRVELLQHKLRMALQELGSAYEVLNEKVQQTMLDVFGSKDVQELYETQRRRVMPLIDICDDPNLKSLLQAFARECRSPGEWVRGIAGNVMKKPLDSWDDQRFTPFATKIRDYAERIKQLEILASKNGIAKNNTRVVSIMLPGGQMKRESINVNGSRDAEIQNKVNEILSLPKDKAKTILAVLAEKLFESDVNE